MKTFVNLVMVTIIVIMGFIAGLGVMFIVNAAPTINNLGLYGGTGSVVSFAVGIYSIFSMDGETASHHVEDIEEWMERR